MTTPALTHRPRCPQPQPEHQPSTTLPAWTITRCPACNATALTRGPAPTRKTP